jgi:glycosyltransferase involved in cell wall biosynthesis
MNDQKVSIVIPTWNRSAALINCIEKLVNENVTYDKYEILVCDSKSTDDTKEKINNFILVNSIKNLKIFQCAENSVTLKRNTGIRKAKYENIVLLDDDCIPINNFISTYLDHFKTLDNKTILCGQYRAFQADLINSNYIRYRDSRNYGSFLESKKNKELNYLKYQNIVTGNLGFKKAIVIKDNILFNEKIIGYGGEDIDWAWRLIEKGFKLMKSNIKVIHNETSYTITAYKKKHFHYSYGAMPLLIKYNLEAASNLPFYFLENSKNNLSKKIMLFLLRFILNKYIVNFLIFFLEKTDKYKIFYFSTLYRIVILRSYIDGIYARKKNLITISDIKKGWYSKGYK